MASPRRSSNLAGDGEALGVELDGAAGLAKRVVGEAEVAEVGALAAAVADGAVKGERLLVERDRTARVAQRVA